MAAKVKELDYFTRLNRCFRSDLYWWHFFLSDRNGISFLQLATSGVRPDLFIQTDASGSWGRAAYFNRQWLQWHWPPGWESVCIMGKELVPVVLSCAVWGPILARCRVLYQGSLQQYLRVQPKWI